MSHSYRSHSETRVPRLHKQEEGAVRLAGGYVKYGYRPAAANAANDWGELSSQ